LEKVAATAELVRELGAKGQGHQGDVTAVVFSNKQVARE